jgi:hypothetical protein
MIERWVESSRAYLASAKAQDSLAADPYWPKWDSPWWHMQTLWEVGRVDAIPPESARAMLEAVATHYVPFFPNPREPMTSGRDVARESLCHCALGHIYQVLRDCGLDVDARAPWARRWFLRYQLPDGGLNCDEKAYETGSASSIQSTLPALEAVLRGAKGSHTPAEEAFLDKGAQYLMERKLAFRRSDGKPMDPAFLEVCFPRFYDYDVLRGLGFLVEWVIVRGGKVPDEAVAPAMKALVKSFPDGVIKVQRPGLPAEGTLRLKDGAWSRAPENSAFALLDHCRRPGTPIPALSKAWSGARAAFSRVLL